MVIIVGRCIRKRCTGSRSSILTVNKVPNSPLNADRKGSKPFRIDCDQGNRMVRVEVGATCRRHTQVILTCETESIWWSFCGETPGSLFVPFLAPFKCTLQLHSAENFRCSLNSKQCNAKPNCSVFLSVASWFQFARHACSTSCIDCDDTF